jgi:opacity protein-like surface antigen
MMRPILCLIFIAICVTTAFGQTDTPRFEVFGGYSHLRQERIQSGDFTSVNGLTPAQVLALTGQPITTNSGRAGLNGFDVSVTGYVTKRFGLTGDFSANFKSEGQTFFGNPSQTKLRTIYFLGGPQYKFFNESKATPFVRALFGGSNNRNEVTNALATATDKYTKFAMALGGGLDLRVSKHVDLRLFQIEWTPVFAKDRRVVATDGTIFDLRGSRRNDWRFSVGVVFK